MDPAKIRENAATGSSIGGSGWLAPLSIIRAQTSEFWTITPNSSDGKRVVCPMSATIRWSIEIPPANPAGVPAPPIVSPGRSSMPVSMCPMPFMWSSPGPNPADFTLMPLSTRSFFWNGASAERMGESVKAVSVPVGSQLLKIVPFAEKTTTSRLGGAVAAQTLRGKRAVPASAALAPSSLRRLMPAARALMASPRCDSGMSPSG